MKGRDGVEILVQELHGEVPGDEALALAVDQARELMRLPRARWTGAPDLAVALALAALRVVGHFGLSRPQAIGAVARAARDLRDHPRPPAREWVA